MTSVCCPSWCWSRPVPLLRHLRHLLRVLRLLVHLGPRLLLLVLCAPPLEQIKQVYNVVVWYYWLIRKPENLSGQLHCLMSNNQKLSEIAKKILLTLVNYYYPQNAESSDKKFKTNFLLPICRLIVDMENYFSGSRPGLFISLMHFLKNAVEYKWHGKKLRYC